MSLEQHRYGRRAEDRHPLARWETWLGVALTLIGSALMISLRWGTTQETLIDHERRITDSENNVRDLNKAMTERHAEISAVQQHLEDIKEGIKRIEDKLDGAHK